MTRLARSSFDKAAEYIAQNARAIDRALFDFHFGSGSIDSVVKELRRFQNEDGGFGHGIEPDVRMPFSSPFSTTLAFQVLREIDVEVDAPVVREGVAYFESSYDSSIGGWDPTGPQVDEFPHAVWWNYSPVEGQLAPLLRSNPGAEIVGYLHRYGSSLDAAFVQDATAELLAVFDSLPDDMEFHAMLCFVRMAELSPDSVADRLLPKLRRGVRMVTGNSADDWLNYGGRPLSFAPWPDSSLAEVLADPVQAQLDFEIELQAADGSWQPNWNWGQFEETWPVAKLEWAGNLTLKSLLTLKAWDRL